MNSETIPGSYSLITMPDGTQKLVSKISIDGRQDWVFVEDRIKKQEEFENRFANTETRPDKWDPKKTDVLIPKVSIEKLVHVEDVCTKQHLLAHLIEVFGDPERILYDGTVSDRVEKIKANRVAFATYCEIMRVVKDPEWSKVLKVLTDS